VLGRLAPLNVLVATSQVDLTVNELIVVALVPVFLIHKAFVELSDALNVVTVAKALVSAFQSDLV
jgi:hypothetical protein